MNRSAWWRRGSIGGVLPIPDPVRAAAARIGLAFLLLVPPLLEGGESSAGLLAVHTAVFLLVAVGPRLDLRAAARRLPFAWLALGAVCGWATISFWGATYRFGSFVSLFDLILFFLLFVLVLGGNWTDRDRAGARRCLVVAATVQGVWAVAAFAVRPEMRPTAGFVNPNHLAAFLIVGFWAAAADALGAGARQQRSAAGAAALLILAGVLATGSRGALAALVAVLVVAVFVAGRGGGRRTVAAVVAVAILAGAAGVTLVYRFRTREDPYALGRARIWPAAVRIGADHPVLGVGPGMLESRAFNYNPPEPGAAVRYSKVFRSAHSSYLQVFAETGVPGLVFALLAAAPILRMLLRPGRDPGHRFPWLGCALATLMLHGLVENLIGIPALSLAILIPAGLELSRTEGREAEPARVGHPLGVRIAGVTAWLFLYWVFVGAPFLADRQFGRMRAARDADSFLRHMRAAVRHNPFQPYYYSEAVARVMRGTATLGPEGYAVCHGWLRTAIDLEPGEPAFHRQMARLQVRGFLELFRDVHTRDRALRSFDAAFERNRTDPRALVEKARFERLIGRPEAALESLGRALEVEPFYLAARLERVEILSELGPPEAFHREAAEAGRILAELEDYRPRNEYEESILAIEADRWDRLLPDRSAVPPAPSP